MACYGRCLSLHVVSAFVACHFWVEGEIVQSTCVVSVLHIHQGISKLPVAV